MKTTVKSVIRAAAAGAYHSTRLFQRRLRGKAAILMYHRVLPDERLNDYYLQPGMYVTRDAFEMQMRFLKEHFDLVAFETLLDLWENRGWDEQKRYCVITFDDGWKDNYDHAFPVLQKYGIPATIFLPTQLIGTNQWPWPDKVSYLIGRIRERGKSTVKNNGDGPLNIIDGGDPIDRVIERCKSYSTNEVERILSEEMSISGMRMPDERLLLDWHEVEEMSHHDISFGSHTCTHAILTNVDVRMAEQEIAGSLQQLRERRINHIPVFCYPNGGYSDQMIGLLKETGYRAAVTTRFGYEDGNSGRELYRLHRIGIHNDITNTIPLFSSHLSGLNNRGRSMR